MVLEKINQRIDCPDAAKLLLRLTLGCLLLFHGVHKASPGGDLHFIQSLLIQHGVSPFISYGIFITEILCPILIILGVLTRWCGISVAITMVIAVVLVNGSNIFSLAPTGAWIIESAAFYFLLGVILFLQGGGRYCLSHSTAWQ